MAHVVIPNNPPAVFAAPGHAANHIWLLCLGLIKAGWRYMGSSGGAAKDTSVDPRNNKFAAPATTGASGSAASIGAKDGYDVTVTGLTGMVVPLLSNRGGSEGNFLVFTGAANAGNNTIMQITEVLSATSVKCRPVITLTSAVANDGNNGSIGWTEYDPTKATYNTSWPNNPYWIVLRGPSTIKMTFTAGPTGTFQRGERVTQAGSGAEGEVLGITYNPATGAGWINILPQVAGTGAGAHGWNTSSNIVGTSSGAVIQTATITEYVVEICLSGAVSDTNGRIRGGMHAWTICAALDGGTEQAMLASTLMSSSGCTTSVYPGAGGTGNAFPALGMCFIGASNTSSYQWYTQSAQDLNNSVSGNCQLMIANAIPRRYRAADGTFTIAPSSPSTGPYTMHGWSHQRLDDTEEGDVWPYAIYSPGWNTYDDNWVNTTNYRTGAAMNTEVGGHWVMRSFGHNQQRPAFWAWKGRGLASGGNGTTDRFAPVHGTMLVQCPGAPFSSSNNVVFGYNTGGDPEQIACAAVPTMYKEHLWLTSTQGGKYRKGRTRWLAIVGALASAFDTWGGKSWLHMRSTDTNNPQYTGAIVGPWDGVTTPTMS